MDPLIPPAETLKRETPSPIKFHLKSIISMIYDITKNFSPVIPKLGKGTKCYKLLLSQASNDVKKPLVPMLFPSMGTH